MQEVEGDWRLDDANPEPGDEWQPGGNQGSRIRAGRQAIWVNGVVNIGMHGITKSIQWPICQHRPEKIFTHLHRLLLIRTVSL